MTLTFAALGGALLLGLTAQAPDSPATVRELVSWGALAPAQEVLPGTQRLEAQRVFLLRDIEAAAGAEAAGAMGEVLDGLLDKEVASVTESGQELTRPRAARIVRSLKASAEWRDALVKTLGEEQAAKVFALDAQRQEAAHEARVGLATTLIGFELRLRASGVEILRPRVANWLEDRTPTRSQLMAGDLVDEALTVRPIASGFLLPVQLAGLERMRSADKPNTPGAKDPGDDLDLGRGRYPEDDFLFEAAALAQFHGWEWAEHPDLAAAAWMLGREERRSGRRQARFGDSSLFKSLTDPRKNEMWRAIVERKCAQTEGQEPVDPGPAFSDDPGTLVGARLALVMALLEARVSLTPKQWTEASEVFGVFINHEFTARVVAFGALDDETIWRELRFVEGKSPRRGAVARRQLCKALDEILDPHQRTELGL